MAPTFTTPPCLLHLFEVPFPTAYIKDPGVQRGTPSCHLLEGMPEVGLAADRCGVIRASEGTGL